MAVAVGARCELCAIIFISVSLMDGAISSTFASAFFNPNGSASAASVSAAGQTAEAEDASTIFYNAAGMALLDRPEALVASGLIFPSTSFSNRGTSDALGETILGPTATNAQLSMVPSIFVTTPIDDRLHIGLGIFMPFGQSNKYDDNWVGRYQVQTASLRTIDIDPAIAYRATNWLSLGAGLDIQYAHLVRKNAIDFGSLCVLTLGPITCPVIGLLPQRADGRLVTDLSDWNVGYNLGLLLTPTDATRIGVSYRSAVQHSFSGTARFDVPAAAEPLTAGGLLFQNTNARSSLTFPDVVAVGMSQRIDDRLTALIDIDYTLWSHVKQLTLAFSNPAQPTQTQPLDWHNSLRVAVGGTYRITDSTEIRSGVSYDQSPISNAFRTADLPDADNITISVGITERLADRIWVSASYSYGHAMDAPLNVAMRGAGTLVGTSHTSSNVVGLQARFQF
jgi:long-chain fatty acid transport protein